MKTILLMGNPNVGKSAVFARLTGADVIASNYPGTTVEFTRGRMKLGGQMVDVIDVPGTYTLEPTSRAEQVAVDMLSQGDVVINVIDATALERSLSLALHLLRSGPPVIVALNMWDAAGHVGITIDVPALEARLGVPVVPTCALTGEGFKQLVDRIGEARARGTVQFDDADRWTRVGQIVEAVQTVTHRHHTFLEVLGDASVHPVLGLVFAALVGAGAFGLIRLIGEGLIGWVAGPFFTHTWEPVVRVISQWLGGSGWLHGVLIGPIGEAPIDYLQPFGLLTTGLYVPLAMVLPYVLGFYLVLSIAEDSGYLPRLGVLVDALMHRLGLHGLAIVPMLLGLGCNVPGALATRLVETRKERFMCATLMAISVPCMAQLAMVFGLLGKYGLRGLGPVFATLIALALVLGVLLSRFVHGETPEVLVEIPPYRLPYWPALVKKLWIRARQFVSEAVPFVLLGVLLVNVLRAVRVFGAAGYVARPIVTGVLGLPSEAAAALLVGFLRKDVAVGMLAPLGLSLRQLIVASVVLMIYFPCIATFMVLVRELGWKDMLKSAAIMAACALVVGGGLNVVLKLLSY